MEIISTSGSEAKLSLDQISTPSQPPDENRTISPTSNSLQFKFNDSLTGIRYYTHEVSPSKHNLLYKQLDQKRKQRLQKRLQQLSDTKPQFNQKRRANLSSKQEVGGSSPSQGQNSAGSFVGGSESGVSGRLSARRKGVLLEGVADDSSHFSDDYSERSDFFV